MYAELFEIIAGGFNSSVLLDQLHLEKCRQGNLVALKKIPDVAFYDLVESKLFVKLKDMIVADKIIQIGRKEVDKIEIDKQDRQAYFKLSEYSIFHFNSP